MMRGTGNESRTALPTPAAGAADDDDDDGANPLMPAGLPISVELSAVTDRFDPDALLLPLPHNMLGDMEVDSVALAFMPTTSFRAVMPNSRDAEADAAAAAAVHIGSRAILSASIKRVSASERTLPPCSIPRTYDTAVSAMPARLPNSPNQKLLLLLLSASEGVGARRPSACGRPTAAMKVEADEDSVTVAAAGERPALKDADADPAPLATLPPAAPRAVVPIVAAVPPPTTRRERGTHCAYTPDASPRLSRNRPRWLCTLNPNIRGVYVFASAADGATGGRESSVR